jgi:UDP-glucose 4-epimerase
MRVLVTGGAGFIGSHLAHALVDAGADVAVLDDLSTGALENVPPAATMIVGSVTDGQLLSRAVDGHEVVFHQAALKTVARSVEEPLATNDVNVTGTLRVVLACRDAGVRRLVYASSSSIYGGLASRPTPETAPTAPRSPYAISKLAGELYCRVAWDLYGLETVALRYFNVYGPRQRPDSRYAAVIPLFIQRVLGDQPVDIDGDGCQSRDFTYVADTVAANLLAAEAPAERCAGRAFNIATQSEHTVLDLLAALEDIVGRRAERRHRDARPGDVRHSCADTTDAQQQLGYRASVTLSEGLTRTVDWLRSCNIT